MRTSHGVELIYGSARYAEQRDFDLTIQLDSLGVLELVMKHFFIKARVLEQMGTEADFDLVDRACSEAGKWAREVANFRHPQIASIRSAGDPNGPVLPQDMDARRTARFDHGGYRAVTRNGRARSAAATAR